jgi:metal-responsive CopG/Arc/MetJ family transcriptional regulator
MQMKTAISIPDPVFRSAERLADRLGISRSELYCRAVKDLLERHDQVTITARLNEIYGPSGAISSLEPRLVAMQTHSIRGKGKS